MTITTEAIVVSAIKYGETSLICKLFTAKKGIRSYIVKGVLSPKKKTLTKGHFQPLTQLEIVVSNKNNSLEYLKEAKITHLYQNLYYDVTKSTIALFLGEVLTFALKEEEENNLLFRYLTNAFIWLDLHENTANFHIAFLIGLTKYLGVYPNTNTIEAPYFDLKEGEFTYSKKNELITKKNLTIFKQFLQADFDTASTIQLNKNEKTTLLNNLIGYYELHISGFKKPKSLKVLTTVFAED